MRLRVLLCGSRNWTDAVRVYDDLHFLLWRTQDLRVLTVLHANTLIGPERAAKTFIATSRSLCMFAGRDIVEEVHEPAWGAYGDAARIEANTEMLGLGVNLVLAYPAASPEVEDCMAKADAMGIPVWNRAVETTHEPV